MPWLLAAHSFAVHVRITRLTKMRSFSIFLDQMIAYMLHGVVHAAGQLHPDQNVIHDHKVPSDHVCVMVTVYYKTVCKGPLIKFLFGAGPMFYTSKEVSLQA